MGMMISAVQTLADELAYLQANYSSMPIAERRARREAAIVQGTAELNRIAEADVYDKAAFMAVYDVVIELDRVGY